MPILAGGVDYECSGMLRDPFAGKQLKWTIPKGTLTFAQLVHYFAVGRDKSSVDVLRRVVPLWTLFAFRDDQPVIAFPGGKTSLSLSTQPVVLFGRDASLCDIVVEHPSLSSQHMVLYFAFTASNANASGDSDREDEFDDVVTTIDLFVCDLASTNGTYMNDRRLAPNVPTALRSNDVLRLGQSTRRYVVLSSSTG